MLAIDSLLMIMNFMEGIKIISERQSFVEYEDVCSRKCVLQKELGKIMLPKKCLCVCVCVCVHLTPVSRTLYDK